MGGGSPFEHHATRLKIVEHTDFITLGLTPGEEDYDLLHKRCISSPGDHALGTYWMVLPPGLAEGGGSDRAEVSAS